MFLLPATKRTSKNVIDAPLCVDGGGRLDCTRRIGMYGHTGDVCDMSAHVSWS